MLYPLSYEGERPRLLGGDLVGLGERSRAGTCRLLPGEGTSGASDYAVSNPVFDLRPAVAALAEYLD